MTEEPAPAPTKAQPSRETPVPSEDTWPAPEVAPAPRPLPSSPTPPPRHASIPARATPHTDDLWELPREQRSVHASVLIAAGVAVLVLGAVLGASVMLWTSNRGAPPDEASTIVATASAADPRNKKPEAIAASQSASDEEPAVPLQDRTAGLGPKPPSPKTAPPATEKSPQAKAPPTDFFSGLARAIAMPVIPFPVREGDQRHLRDVPLGVLDKGPWPVGVRLLQPANTRDPLRVESVPRGDTLTWAIGPASAGSSKSPQTFAELTLSDQTLAIRWTRQVDQVNARLKGALLLSFLSFSSDAPARSQAVALRRPRTVDQPLRFDDELKTIKYGATNQPNQPTLLIPDESEIVFTGCVKRFPGDQSAGGGHPGQEFRIRGAGEQKYPLDKENRLRLRIQAGKDKQRPFLIALFEYTKQPRSKDWRSFRREEIESILANRNRQLDAAIKRLINHHYKAAQLAVADDAFQTSIRDRFRNTVWQGGPPLEEKEEFEKWLRKGGWRLGDDQRPLYANNPSSPAPELKRLRNHRDRFPVQTLLRWQNLAKSLADLEIHFRLTHTVENREVAGLETPLAADLVLVGTPPPYASE